MNQYGSVVDRFIARNVLEQAINPPAAFSIANASWVDAFLRSLTPTAFTTRYINRNSNMILRRAGLFCNFADGLVIDGTNRIDLGISFRALNASGAIISGNFTAGSTALTGGTAFLTELSAGDIVLDPVFQPFRIASVTNDTDAVLDERAIFTGPANTTVYSQSAFYGVHIPGIQELNQMYDHEIFAPIGSYALTTPDFIFAAVSLANEDTTSTVDYMSKTISTAYAGDTARFDVYADIEFTRA